MNIRRKLATLLAVTAGASSLVVGLGTQAAHASCDLPRMVTPASANVSVIEGNNPSSGYTYLVFKLNSAGCNQAVSVNYSVTEDWSYSATLRAKSTQPGQDFVAKTGTVSWSYGATGARYIYVQVVRDWALENNEAFKLSFTSTTGFAQTTIGKVATGHIIDDDTN